VFCFCTQKKKKKKRKLAERERERGEQRPILVRARLFSTVRFYTQCTTNKETPPLFFWFFLYDFFGGFLIFSLFAWFLVLFSVGGLCSE